VLKIQEFKGTVPLKEIQISRLPDSAFWFFERVVFSLIAAKDAEMRFTTSSRTFAVRNSFGM